VTEVGFGFRLGKTGGLDKGWLVSELGLMRNLDKHYAAGATTYIVYDTQFSEFRAGLKLRGRRWLSRGLSVNASGGLLFLGGVYGEKQPGFASHIDINYKDFVAAYVGCDVLRGDTGSYGGTKWHIGTRFGSHVGSSLSAVAAGVVAAALFILATAG
jgi:hypothetical protein